MRRIDVVLTGSAWLVRIGCVLVVLYVIAEAVWYFGVGPSSSQHTTNYPLALSPIEEKIDIARISTTALFGTVEEVQPTSLIEDLQETTLDLTLHGTIIATDSNAASVALISHRNRAAGVSDYQVGDTIGSLAEVTEIHPRFIVISRNGEHERLTFNAKRLFSVLPQQNREVLANVDQATTGIDNETKSNNPARSLQIDSVADLTELGLSEVHRNGETVLQINNVSVPSQLTRLGMQAGDVVLSVNGFSLETLRQSESLANEILNAETARLEVQRGSRLFYLTVPTR